jgi:ABC-type lipoprotein export system ATPase subunit
VVVVVEIVLRAEVAGDRSAIRMKLIELQDIHRVYRLGEMDLHVLKGISLSIDRGEMVSLMGQSGSGKTTLMNTLGFLDHPTSGRYLLDGEDVTEVGPDRRALIRSKMIGFVFQSFNLLPRTSALEQVMMPLAYAPEVLSPSAGRKRAEDLLKMVGLADRMDHMPTQLSGGQQQRVAIARALVNRPSILFADEPTGNLDSRTSVEILQMFRELNANEGITVVLVTHSAEIAEYSDRRIVLKDGSLESDSGYTLSVHAHERRGEIADPQLPGGVEKKRGAP